MPIVRANYVPTSAATWQRRITAALRYYSRRPGRDLDELRQRDPHVRGRWFLTADGHRLPLREAQDRLLAEIEARREAWRAQAAGRREVRHSEAAARFEARCRRFLEGEADPCRGGRRLSPERRAELVARWRTVREARERLPDPVFRVYRVVLSTSSAVLDGRDVEHVLGTALGGAVGAVAGSLGHAGTRALRHARDAHERAVARAQWAEEREARREAEAERRRQEREALARERRRQRADARFAAPFLYVRHDGPGHSHPHVHALLLTDHRGLDTRDLERMREALAARERLRQREQDRTRAHARAPEPEHHHPHRGREVER